MTNQDYIEIFNCSLETLADEVGDDILRGMYGMTKDDKALTRYIWFWALSKWDVRRGAYNVLTYKQLQYIISRLNS